MVDIFGGKKIKMWGIYVDLFGETPRNRILEFLLEMSGLDYTIGDISRETGINRATTYNVMNELIEEKIVIATRKISGAQAYKLNTEKKQVKLLEISFKNALEIYANKPQVLSSD